MEASEKFWWEDGYKLPDTDDAISKVPSRQKKQEILEGAKFLQETIGDTSNTFMGITNETGELLVTLVDAGKALGSTVDVYDLTSQPTTLLRQMVVDEKCGYMSLSSCETLLAVGVLKEDRTMILDFQTGELLVNLHGGYKSGFFGSLHFSKKNRNLLLEQRVVRQTSAGPQQSVYRLWDLGFKQESSAAEGEKAGGRSV